MRVAVLANPSSGRGRAKPLVESLAVLLASRGHESFVRWVREAPLTSDDLRGCDLLVLAGGDGTVHHALPLLIESGVAMYHLPLGTENLLAREFGMKRAAEPLLRAMDAGRIRACDVGFAGATPFVLMCGIGPDARIVHRVAASRRGTISHLSYIGPCLREALRPGIPRVTIECDGREIVREERGVVVVANCRQYGFRINPAPLAGLDDGLLDVVFMPANSSLAVIGWAARGKLGRLTRSRRWKHVQATEAKVRWHGPEAHIQMDGEAKPSPSEGVLAFRVRPKCLRILESARPDARA